MNFNLLYSVTSRPPRELEENGKNYWFLDREEMERQIRQHKFLEYGEHNGNLYGTSLDSIRNVINEGKMCVLDCSPPVSVKFCRFLVLTFIVCNTVNLFCVLGFENSP